MASETSFFDGLRDAMAEGLDALRKGSVLTTRDVSLPPAPRPMSPAQIMRLRRDKLHVSQALFARLTNTAVQTVQAWEQGRTKPSGCALRVLRLVDRNPQITRDLAEAI